MYGFCIRQHKRAAEPSSKQKEESRAKGTSGYTLALLKKSFQEFHSMTSAYIPLARTEAAVGFSLEVTRERGLDLIPTLSTTVTSHIDIRS